MTLYATTTSERASEGQGGNKYLKIELIVQNDSGERIKFDNLTLKREGDFFTLYSQATKTEIVSPTQI